MVSNKISLNHLSTKSVQVLHIHSIQSFYVGIITEILMSVNINEHYLNVGSHPYFTYFITLHFSKIGYFFMYHFFRMQKVKHNWVKCQDITVNKWEDQYQSKSPNSFTAVFSFNHYIFMISHFLTFLCSGRHS